MKENKKTRIAYCLLAISCLALIICSCIMISMSIFETYPINVVTLAVGSVTLLLDIFVMISTGMFKYMEKINWTFPSRDEEIRMINTKSIKVDASKPIKVGQTNRVDLKTKDFTTDDVVKDTEAHIEAVKNSCQFLEDKMHSQVEHHDYTKLGNTLPEFEYALKNDFKTNPATGVDWWKYHYMTERHHLNDNCPDDVNLIDVMEMIADCVCAGEARNGTVYPVKISPEILEKAVANTQKLLEDNIEVVPNQNKLKDVDKSNSK